MSERIEELMIDYLNGTLSSEDKLEWEDFVDRKLISQEDIEAYRSLFGGLDQIGKSEPSEEMSENFYTMLNAKLNKVRRYTILDHLASILYNSGLSRGGLQAAYSLVVLLMGLGAGYLLLGKSDQAEIAVLSGEVREMKAMMMFNLLEKASPSERIKAVGLVQEMTDVDEEIIQALFTTLNGDANTNVRLEALDALVRYADIADVRAGLIKSLSEQSSPLVQVALADIMVLLQDKEARGVLQHMIDREDIPSEVKQILEVRINEIKI